jgi:hypothetical protein
LNTEPVRSFKPMGSDYPQMQWHIPEECSPHQHHCEIIKIKKLVLPWLLNKFPTFYGNLKAHYHGHPTIQLNPVPDIPCPCLPIFFLFFTIHFNITFSTTPKSRKWSPTNICVIFSLFHSNPILPSDNEISEHFSGSTGMNLKMMD